MRISDWSSDVCSSDLIDLSKSGSTHLPRPVGRQFMQEIERAYRAEVKTHGFDAIFTGNGGDNVFCYLHSAAPIVDRLRSAHKSEQRQQTKRPHNAQHGAEIGRAHV